MRLIIQPDYNAVSKWAAWYVAKSIIDFKPDKNKPFVLGLPTGSSPLGMYKELISLCQKAKISFRNVVTFNMDEYVGLPVDHPGSYHSYMHTNFFKHIDIRKENFNIPDGNASDPDAECERYENKIREYGGVNLFVGGIGPDGHIAFNEPGSSLGSLTRVKTLTEDTLLANARFFDDDVVKVPKMALTVGVKTVLDSDQVLIIISGHPKARALAKVVEDGVNHMWTVSALQLHPKGLIVCDESSTVELKVGTVNYFKRIESANLNADLLLRNL
ncbi:MAG: glucosamine-6-phosphate deaminase [Calditrichaceae bacterium]